MRTFCLALILAVIGSQSASGQVIANPYVKVSPKKKAALPRAQSARDATAAQLKSKDDLEDALNDLYKYEQNLTERARIWAETADEWTDIRIVEANVSKAESHFAAAGRHWEAGRYTAIGFAK